MAHEASCGNRHSTDVRSSIFDKVAFCNNANCGDLNSFFMRSGARSLLPHLSQVLLLSGVNWKVVGSTTGDASMRTACEMSCIIDWSNPCRVCRRFVRRSWWLVADAYRCWIVAQAFTMSGTRDATRASQASFSAGKRRK